MIRQYLRRYKSNRGRCDRNLKPIPDRVIYKGVVVAEVRNGRIYLGYALINPHEPIYGMHNREGLNEIAERRLMSGRYSVPLHPSTFEIRALLTDYVDRRGHAGGVLRIPRQIHGVFCDVIERACRTKAAAASVRAEETVST